jgi:Methyltransferase domain
MRPALRTLRSHVAGTALRGSAVGCPCCGGEFRRFLGHDGLANVRCPRCRSAPRHRLLWLWLTQRAEIARRPLRVLHFAPEPGIARALRALPDVEYLSGDLDPALAMRRLDVCALPFEPGSWDLIVFVHVLTYVADDRRALGELRRVLAPGGMLVMQNPVDELAARKYDAEDAYGLRRYGRDLPDLVRAAGFAVEVHRLREELDEGTVERFGLHAATHRPHVRGDDIYACTLASSPRSDRTQA